MPEDVTAKLARFSPTGLDRDATLFATAFAAGKAAGRRAVWKWLTAGLVVSNAVTLAALAWPKPTPPVVVVPPAADPPDVWVEPYGPPTPSSYLALMNTIDTDIRSTTSAGDGPVPSSPLTPRSLRDPKFQ